MKLFATLVVILNAFSECGRPLFSRLRGRPASVELTVDLTSNVSRCVLSRAPPPGVCMSFGYLILNVLCSTETTVLSLGR